MSVALKELPTAADVRRVNRLVARAVALELLRRGSHRLAQLDAELMPTDRILQRWAASVGNGLPSDYWDDSPKSRPPPLDEETAIIVDQVVLHAPRRQQVVIRQWYKTSGASSVIAETLGVSRTGLYLEWRAALGYVRNRLAETRNSELLGLLAASAE